MKVAVYTIARNEEQFVERWYNSAKLADYLLIVDTGSTDNTVTLAEQLGITVVKISIKHWRFDDARNAALVMLPDDIDYCIALDMDEVLVDGWRDHIELLSGSNITRPRYQYTWNWKLDGTAGLQYGGDKIHTRHGYRWKHPVHEVLVPDRIEEVGGWVGLQIHHHPDTSKSRGSYLPLLELSIKEDGQNHRNAFYYARELFYYKQFELAIKEFERYLNLPHNTFKAERAAAMRYLAKMNTSYSVQEQWLKKAVAEAPNRREGYVELGKLYYEQEQWELCLQTLELAISINEKPLEYLCEEFAWGSIPYDYAAIAAYKLGLLQKATKYGQKAVELNPNDERLISNLGFYK